MALPSRAAGASLDRVSARTSRTSDLSTSAAECGRALAPATSAAAASSRPAAAEDRETAEQRALRLAQQIPGMVEHRAQAAMPCWHIAAGGRQDIQVRADLPLDLGEWQLRTPAAASSIASGMPATCWQIRTIVVRVASVERQLWLDLPGALHEQLDRAVVGQIRQALRARRPVRLFVRVGEPIDVEQPFGLQVQSLARGDQHRELRRVRKDGGDQIGAVKQMLEVVEHEQHVPLAQIAEQVGGRVGLPGEREAEAYRRSPRRSGWRADRGERDKRDAIGERGGLSGRDLRAPGAFCRSRPARAASAGDRLGRPAVGRSAATSVLRPMNGVGWNGRLMTIVGIWRWELESRAPASPDCVLFGGHRLPDRPSYCSPPRRSARSFAPQSIR